MNIQINKVKRTGLWLATFLTLVSANTLTADQSTSLYTGHTEAASPFTNFAVIEEGDLAEMRGGYSFGGIEMSFGAFVETIIDNIKLQTVVNITTAGANIVSQMLSDAAGYKRSPATDTSPIAIDVKDTLAGRFSLPVSVSRRTPGSISATQAPLPGPRQTASAPTTTSSSSAAPVLVGSDSGISVTDIAPANVNLSGVAESGGFVIKDSGGFTAALHQITQKAIQTTLASTRSNQQIRQSVDVRVDITNAKNAFASSLRSSIINRVNRQLR